MSRIFYIGDPDVFSILDLGLKNAHIKMFNSIESYNKSFYELGFEYDKNGTVLTPWSNQFPDPIKYSSKKDKK